MNAKKNQTMNTKKLKVSQIIIYTYLALLSIIYIAPLLWVVLVSGKTNSEIFTSPFSIPKVFQWENYKIALSAGKLGQATINSLIVCGITLAVSMVIGAMISFAIGRMKWKMSKMVMAYFMMGMMVPVHSILIPLFTTFSKYQLNNSLLGVMLPYITFALPTVIFILTGFFRSMPNEIFEAACIDGCNIYECFFKIALPLAKTGFAVVGMMTFVSTWNELLLAMVFISDPLKKTLPVALTAFVGPYSTNYVQMFAAIVIAVIPTIVVYSIFSNQIVEGLTAGAVKG